MVGRYIGGGALCALIAASCTGDIGDAPPASSPGDPEVAAIADAPDPLVVRLTDVQYGFALSDVLGVSLTADERDQLPRDVPAEAHYATNAEGQFFNSQYVIAYAEIARSVVARLDPVALRSDFGGCDDASAPCLEAFIRGLGRLLFRRPLSDDEVTDFGTLAETVAALPEADADDGVRAVVEALLQSPPFLYRLEDETSGSLDEIRAVGGYELASRLAFFLWQSAPDDALLEFAAAVPASGLVDRDALATEVERMMADPRFARSRAAFWSDYTLVSTAPFAFATPEVADDLRASLLTTMDRLSGVDAEARPILDMFTTEELWMTPSVAELAGAASTKDGLAAYGTDELEQRVGITTHPSFLGAIGTTSFVGRGVFMSQRLLCIDIISPPSDEDAFNRIQETAAETEELTPREASVFRFNLEPACRGCHQQFEPIAYAFERYDLEGRYTETDDDGRDLFSDGRLPSARWMPEIPFEDPEEMLTGLRDTERVGRCLVENMMEYATGYDVGRARDAIGTAYETFVTPGTFDELVRAVALNPQVRAQKVVAEP
ncbi:MAG: DUF1592 domain-containing protein [Myxococcota bacterium]